MFEKERFTSLVEQHVECDCVETLDYWTTADLELLADLVRDELDARLQEDLDEYETDDDQ